MDCVIKLVIFLFTVQIVTTEIPTYYMLEMCGSSVDMGRNGISAGILKLSTLVSPISGLCRMHISAPLGKRLLITNPSNGLDTYLYYFDGPKQRDLWKADELIGGGWHIKENKIKSTGKDATFVIESERERRTKAYTGMGSVMLVFTAFTTDKYNCSGYTCYTGGECIDSSFECDGVYNCDSELPDDEVQCDDDSNSPKTNVVIGVLSAVAAIILLVSVICGMYYMGICDNPSQRSERTPRTERTHRQRVNEIELHGNRPAADRMAPNYHPRTESRQTPTVPLQPNPTPTTVNRQTPTAPLLKDDEYDPPPPYPGTNDDSATCPPYPGTNGDSATCSQYNRWAN